MSMLAQDDDDTGAPAPAQPVQRIGMWDQERDSPWLYAGLYAAAMLAGLLGHHLAGWAALLLGGAP